MGGYYDQQPYDNSIDQDLCRTYEGFYYYRVYDLKADMLLNEWHLWENCKVVTVGDVEDGDAMTYIVKKN